MPDKLSDRLKDGAKVLTDMALAVTTLEEKLANAEDRWHTATIQVESYEHDIQNMIDRTDFDAYEEKLRDVERGVRTLAEVIADGI